MENVTIDQHTVGAKPAEGAGILAAAFVACFVVLAGGFLYLNDLRYVLLFVFFLPAAVWLLAARQKLVVLRNLLVFSVVLRVINANISKRFPSLEYAFPNLNVYDIVLAAAILGIMGRRIFSGVPIRTPRGRGHAAFLLLVLMFLISILFISQTPEFGFDRFFTVMEMYLTYLVIFNLTRSDDDIKAVFRIVVYAALFEAALAMMELALGTSSPLYQFIAGSEIAPIGEKGVLAGRRIAGSFGESVVFGWVMGYAVFYLLPFVLARETALFAKRKIVVVSLMLVFGFGLITMTRTSLVAEILLAPVGIYLLSRFVGRRLWRVVPKFLGAAALLVVLVLLVPGGSKLISARSSDQEELESTLELRLVSWNVGWRILQDYPLLGMGVGGGTVFAYSSRLLDPYLQSSQEESRISFAGIHNGHAIMFAEMGAIGYSCYLLFLWFFGTESWRLASRQRSIFEIQVGAVGVMVIGFLFLSDFTGIAMTFRSAMNYVAIALALVSVMNARQKSTRLVARNG